MNGSVIAAPAAEADPSRPGHATCSVWWATPSAGPQLYRFLDDAERQRASRIEAVGSRERYVTAHALVRLVLAARTGRPATDLRFDRTCRRCGADHGKPELVDDGPAGSGTPAFNLAHAGDRVVVAVLEENGRGVGIDVEPIPGPADPVMASGGEGILTATELASFRRMPSHRRPHALVAWWTRKEAVLKATGQGLSILPSTIEVAPPDSPPALMVGPRSSGPGSDGADGTVPPGPRSGLTGDGASVSLRDLAPGPGYVGCVAVVGATTLAVTEHDAGQLLEQA